MMTTNQIMAKVLFSNNLVSEKQIQEYWGKIDASHDLGALLLAAGILDAQTYAAVSQYVKDLEVKLRAAEEAKTAPKPAPAPSAPQSPKPAASAFERPKAQTPKAPAPQASPKPVPSAEAPKPSVEEEKPLALEGNNPYGNSSATSVQIEKVEGLEQTSIATAVIAPTEELEADSEKTEDEVLPDRFEIETGEGTIDVPAELSTENSLAEILAFARKFNATDVYLSETSPIAMRICGTLNYVNEKPFEVSQLSKLLSEAKQGFADGYEPVVGVDFSKSFALAGAGRNRLTVTWNETVPTLAIRVISAESIPLDKLYLPPFCADFLKLRHGLVLIVGPSGSGRSTTVGAFGEALSKERHVLLESIEKPIERLLQNANGMTVQKEVGLHVTSGVSALHDAVLSGAGVILFDHMETVEELWAALQASSAGALVFAVTAGNDVYGLLSRLFSAAADREAELAAALSDELKGVIVQHLIPVIDNQGQVLAVEALKVTSSIANLIRRRELIQLPAAIAAAKNTGLSLDDSLQSLVESGYIRGEDAWQRSLNRRRFAAYRPKK
ncbi:MAG: hypothetical protein J6Z31_06705 [Fibrobacter sp.]|nr:hypothetical protein [Fibrobacter sp.]